MTGGYLSSEDEEIKRNKSDNSSFMTPNRLPRARCESAPLGVFQFNSPWEALSVASPLSLVELESDSAARTLDYLGLDDTCSQIRIPFNERRRLSVKSFDDDLVQAPSKSLWVGNLDSNLSSQDILNLFSPYGVVESLRVLPGKECAFVNFAHLNDAVDAFQDMQGGKVGSSIILVGYAKSEQSPDQSDAEPTKSLCI